MKAVFLDLFETLVTDQTPDRPTEEAFAARMGVHPGTLRSWWRETSVARMTGQYPSYEAALRDCCAAVGSPIGEDEFREIVREREDRKRRVLASVEARITSMLEDVADLGLRMAILSNAFPEELLAWRECPLREVAEEAVLSCEVGFMKPQPEIYRLACDKLQVRATDSFFLGDGGFDELRGAARAGMMPLQATWYLARNIEWDSGLPPLQRVSDPQRVAPTLRDLM